jgi:hypothetical protein
MLSIYFVFLVLYLLIGSLITYLSKEEFNLNPLTICNDLATTLLWFPIILFILLIGILSIATKAS